MPYLKGLNALRFFAALLVLVGHARNDLASLGVNNTNWFCLHRGVDAVQFFFTLSGFLLTYLSLHQVEKQAVFNLKHFYLNRVLRIWPLYYLCVSVGFITLGWLLPAYLHTHFLAFTIKEGLPWYLFFLPNYIVAAHPFSNVGALYALWSIGVEEQFYLFFPLLVWALAKTKRPLLLLGVITALYASFYYLNFNGVFNTGFTGSNFINTLKFHFMFTGCFFAVLYKKHQGLVQRLLPDKKLTQIILLALLALVVFTNIPLPEAIYGPTTAALYACFIINTFSATKRVVGFNTRVLHWLGSISYGIYMFHPYISYVFRVVMVKMPVVKSFFTAVPVAYYFGLLAVTVFVAHLSYTYFESIFLRMKGGLTCNTAG